MTQEEKAKRYDEALERARKCLDEKRDTCFVRPDIIFPELAESEDEKIKKWIINSIEDYHLVSPIGYETKMCKKALAWLEKQGNTNETIDRDEFAKGVLRGEMKEAGYEWDAEKNKLRKIVVPIFHLGDTIVKKHNSDINKFGQFTITNIADGKYWYNEFIICDIAEQDDWELVEQKSAEWSEEDKIRLDRICKTLWKNRKGDTDEIFQQEQDVEWLKSLKKKKNGRMNYDTRR